MDLDGLRRENRRRRSNRDDSLGFLATEEGLLLPSEREGASDVNFFAPSKLSSIGETSYRIAPKCNDTVRAIIGAPRIYLLNYLRINRHLAGGRMTHVTRILHIAALRSRTIQRIS
jgi:hypothetical protein